MLRSLFISLIFALPMGLFAQTSHEDYISKYRQIALLEMERTGVPASIKLAQGLHESAIGKSLLATEANNHFGIKALDKTWIGEVYFRVDDDRDPITGELVPSPFRKYNAPEESYRDHSDFLTGRGRYSFLFDLSPRNYKAWAYGLKDAGYATDPKYPSKIINTIEKWNLDRFDSALPLPPLVEEKPPIVIPPLPTMIYLVNDIKVIEAMAGETPLTITARTGVEVEKIMEFNEAITMPSQVLEKGERVFIEEKKKEYKKGLRYHYTQKGESLYDIAQWYGIRLKRLAKRNRMEAEGIPDLGQKIKLTGRRVRRKHAPTWKFPNEQIDLQNPADRNSIEIAEGRAHMVQKGENLYRIALKYNTSVKKLVAINQLKSTDLYIGQVLKIK